MEAIKQAVLKAFPKGCFSREDARRLIAQHPQLKMENNRATHFQLTLRDSNGSLVWQCWNFEPGGSEGLKLHSK
ncbi:TPA: DUF905 domain-containing protein [Klebsiella variicola subsp. variicola]|nr:DUF905 domain-containing protein [Klebsiella variicola subsp. variicola]